MPAATPKVARPHLQGIALMVLAMIALATMDGIAKYLTETYSIPQILCVRFWIFLAFALILARPAGVTKAIRSPRPGLQIVRSLMLMVEMATFILAFSLLPLADVHAVAAVTPLIAMALAAMVLGERIGPHRWAAVVIGFAGVLVIIRPGIGVFDKVTLLPLLAAFLWATYQILVRLVGRTDAGETTVLYTAITGLVIFTAIAPFVWTPPDMEGIVLMLVIGLLGSLGHTFLIFALRLAPASALQPFSYVLPVWAAFMGWLIFTEIPDVWTVLGGAMVAAGGLYAFWRERRAKGAESATSQPSTTATSSPSDT